MILGQKWTQNISYVHFAQKMNICTIYFSTQPHKQKSDWRARQGPHTLCGAWCTQRKESSWLEPAGIGKEAYRLRINNENNTYWLNIDIENHNIMYATTVTDIDAVYILVLC